MTRDQSSEVLTLEMQERGGEPSLERKQPMLPPACAPYLAGVVLQDPRIHVGAIGSVDHDSWRGVAENQRTPLKQAMGHVLEISLQKYTPVCI